MKHYSEADLLETHYTRPGESMPVMMHLADCGECASRYERLEKKLRSITACHDEKPEAFWARQRISIMRNIDRRRERPLAWSRIAAAALLVAALGGVVALRDQEEAPELTVTAATTVTTSDTAAPAPELVSVPADPWQSDELKDFQSVVAWESWVENGDQSL